MTRASRSLADKVLLAGRGSAISLSAAVIAMTAKTTGAGESQSPVNARRNRAALTP